MAREKPDYRATLELLRSTFPGRVELGIKEVSELLNRDRRTLLKDRAFPGPDDWKQVQHLNHGTGKVHELKGGATWQSRESVTPVGRPTTCPVA